MKRYPKWDRDRDLSRWSEVQMTNRKSGHRGRNAIEWTNLVLETSQFSSTFDLCSQDIKDRFFATGRKTRCLHLFSTCVDTCVRLLPEFFPKILLLPSIFSSEKR